MHELQNCVCACVLTTTCNFLLSFFLFLKRKKNHNFPTCGTKQTATYEEIPDDLASMEVCMRHIASLASAIIIVKVSINIGRSAYNT